MLHPLISTLVHRPELVADHVSAYATLVQAEVSAAGGQYVERAVAWALAAAAGLLFVVFAGMALMLGLVMDTFHWALVLVPAAFLLLALLAWLRARTPAAGSAFAELKAQFDEDVRALRSVA